MPCVARGSYGFCKLATQHRIIVNLAGCSNEEVLDSSVSNVKHLCLESFAQDIDRRSSLKKLTKVISILLEALTPDQNIRELRGERYHQMRPNAEQSTGEISG